MSPRKRRPHPLALVPVGFAAAVGGAVVKRLKDRRAHPTGPLSPTGTERATVREDAGAPPSDKPVDESVGTERTCECGQAYRVSGEGRHRVYWLQGASANDPVIGDSCPECDRELPAGAAA